MLWRFSIYLFLSFSVWVTDVFITYDIVVSVTFFSVKVLSIFYT